MNVTKTTRIHSMTLALSFPLVLILFAADAECVQASQKSSDELLLDIMDLHSELVTNEIFLAQAKMLGAYLEAVQPLDESKKIKVYEKVLNILTKIKDSTVRIPAGPVEVESGSEQKTFEGEQTGKSVYEPGAALLEIFKIDPDKQVIPDLPIIRTYWKNHLAFSHQNCLLPERASEIGSGSNYVAKFSFYYEAKQSGKYGFTIVDNRSVRFIRRSQGETENNMKLTIGSIDVVKVLLNEASSQGVCNLKKGFHRIEFWFFDKVEGSYTRGFQVKVLAPGVFDAVQITKDIMLLKKE